MVYIAIGALLLGIICGGFFFPSNFSDFFINQSDLILMILMFLVGISIGKNRDVFKKVSKYHIKIFLIPLGTILASLLAGILCAILLGYPVKQGLSVVSGLGWYSLSGVLVTELYGAELGSVAFLSNLMREILSFLLIPFIVKHFNMYAAIAPAGATSEDTTLPMMIKYTNEEVVVLSIFHGIICSAAVPVLIRLFY